jgi:4-hydroxybenzoate polyprenyltransferase
MAIIDVFLLSSGFILRVYYGGSLINIEVSNWLFLTIMCASLFLSLGKRKKELLVNKNTRASLKEYNEKFLNSFQYIFLGCMFIFYSLWTVEQNNRCLIFTIPLLLCIFMKYSLLLEREDEGDPTTILYSNKMLVLLCFIYVLTMGLFLVIL